MRPAFAFAAYADIRALNIRFKQLLWFNRERICIPNELVVQVRLGHFYLEPTVLEEITSQGVVDVQGVFQTIC